MPESQLPTYEEAKRCPKCGNVGEVRNIINPPREAELKPGTKLHYVYCVTELCRWYDTFYVIQVNADGSVPPPRNHTGERKIYDGFKDHDEKAAQIMEALRRNAERETEPGAELRGNKIV